MASLLFTDSRDFLLDKASAHVKSDALDGKVIGLIIGPHWLPDPLENVISLVEKPCEQLLHAIAFVYVAVERDLDLIETAKRCGQTSQLDERPDEECFKAVLEKLPKGCLAIPFDDSVGRAKIVELYRSGIFTLVFIGPDGRLHSDQGLALLEKWGSEGYPFDEERIATLQKAAQERRDNQNLQVLLVHEGRDELVSSDGGQKIKVADIEGKTVALYFSAHWCPPCQRLTPVLASIYKQLKEKKEDFEIVFVSSDEDQESFDSYFKEMPWLAVPYDAEKTRNLLGNWFDVEGIPTLIILDKQGKTLNTEGIKFVYKYGLEAFPFTAERLEQLKQEAEAKRAALKQEEEAKRAAQTIQSLLVTDERDFVISKYNPVKVSSLEGKIVGLYFSGHWCYSCTKFTPKLISVYDVLRGRGEEFEIVFISRDDDEESFNECYGSMPWLALPFNDKSIKSLSQYFGIGGLPRLVIIGSNGRTVTTDGHSLTSFYGADAFPFSEVRVTELKRLIDEKLDKLPKEVTSAKHEHALILTNNGEVYLCDDCEEQGVGRVYHCAECAYDLHPDCIGKVDNKSAENGHATEGEGAKPGYICEGDVCRKI